MSDLIGLCGACGITAAIGLATIYAAISIALAWNGIDYEQQWKWFVNVIEALDRSWEDVADE